MLGIFISTDGMKVTMIHCSKRGVPRTTQMTVFISHESGLKRDIEKNPKINPSGIAISNVSAKSFSVTPKPLHKSYIIDQKFINSLP